MNINDNPRSLNIWDVRFTSWIFWSRGWGSLVKYSCSYEVRLSNCPNLVVSSPYFTEYLPIKRYGSKVLKANPPINTTTLRSELQTISRSTKFKRFQSCFLTINISYFAMGNQNLVHFNGRLFVRYKIIGRNDLIPPNWRL